MADDSLSLSRDYSETKAADDPTTVVDIPGGYRFSWPQYKLEARINRFYEERQGRTVGAEVLLTCALPGVPRQLFEGWVSFNSVASKKLFRQELETRVPEPAWGEHGKLVEFITSTALKRHRLGEPVVLVGKLPKRGEELYRVNPLLFEGYSTIFFGDGGTCKSYLGILLAVLVQTGTSALGLKVRQGNVLFLDYEMDAEEANERIAAVCAGLGIPLTDLAYRYSLTVLDSDIERIQEIVTEKDIVLVVVDSIAFALGGELIKTQPTISFYQALRSLKTTNLVLGHISKAARGGSGDRSAIGNVYMTNTPRSAWQVRKDQQMGQDTLSVGMFHYKVNSGRLHHSLGFEIRFENDAQGRVQVVHFKRQDVRDMPGISAGLPVREQVFNELSRKAMSVVELHEETGASEDAIRKAINRMGNWVVKVGGSRPTKYGIGKPREPSDGMEIPF